MKICQTFAAWALILQCFPACPWTELSPSLIAGSDLFDGIIHGTFPYRLEQPFFVLSLIQSTLGYMQRTMPSPRFFLFILSITSKVFVLGAYSILASVAVLGAKDLSLA